MKRGLIAYALMAALLCLISSAQAQTDNVGKNAGGQGSTSKTDQNTQPAFSVPIQDAINRIATALENANSPKDTSKEDERSERDILAQEQIAKWAPKMFWLGVAEIVFTAIGVILLYLTLREAQAAAGNTAKFNSRQIAIAGAQTDLQTAQKEIARQQYLAAYRSHLRVRLVKIRPLVAGGQVHIEFQIVNVGTFAAAVTAAQVKIIFNDVSDNGAFTPGCPNWTGALSMPQHIIKAGETVHISQPTDIIFRDWRRAKSEYPGRWDAEGNIHITGVVTYTDDADTIRRTGFYRVSTKDTNRFVRFDSPDINADYEYED